MHAKESQQSDEFGKSADEKRRKNRDVSHFAE